MEYHFQKCKQLHIENHDLNFEYTIQTDSGEVKVQKVRSEKDLGVKFDLGHNNTINATTRTWSFNKTVAENITFIGQGNQLL